MLLNSTSERFPNGLGNDSGTLGKYVAFHNYRAQVSGICEEYSDQNSKGRRPTSAYLPRFRNLYRQETDYLRGYAAGFYSGRGKTRSQEGLGQTLRDNLHSEAKTGPWRVSSHIMGETIPKESNYVALDSNQRDDWDMPLLHINVKYDDNDEINGTISAGEDVTRLNYLRTELLDRASHELKTPLVSIRGNTELLLNYHKDQINPELLPIIENINRNSIRLQTLISHILNASALEAGLVFVNKTTNDLSALIQECVKDLQGLTIHRNLKITLNLHKDLITSFDYRKIKNVIDNLIINAIKYTQLNGKINIQSEILDDSLLVSIEDNGIGLTEEEKSSIFKHFGKIERYGKGWDIEIEGAGLGLFISKGIIELHKGKIWAVSEGRHKGSKFSFTLPKL